VGDSTTIALNLTFFGTLGLAFLMFLGLFLVAILTLVLAGAGRLLVLTVQALFGRLPRIETLPLVRLTGEAGPSSAAPGTTYDDAAAAPSPARGPHAKEPRAGVRTLLTAGRREPQALAEDWAAAVADADARAMARARAAVPEIKVTVRELPSPSLPAAKVEAVAPLVESALHRDIPVREDIPGTGNSRPAGAGTAGTSEARGTGEATGTGEAVPGTGAARSFTKPKAPLSPLDTGSLVSLTGHPKSLRAKLPANKP
jgi:hypothetical protein